MSVELHPLAASPDPSAPPLIGFLPGSNRPYLVFAQGAVNSCVWTFRLLSVTSPIVKLQWSVESGTPASRTVDWRVNVMKAAPGEDVIADSYAGNNDDSGTEGAALADLVETSITLLNLPANLAIGDYVALRLQRLGTGSLGDAVFMHAATLELG